MICNVCGNKTDFTMIKDIAYWNDEKKIFEDIISGGQECVCDVCMGNNREGEHIDSEGDY